MKERFSLDFSTSQGGYEENYDFAREFDSRAVEIELMGLTLETTVSQFLLPNTDTFLRHSHWAFCHCRASSLMGEDGNIQKVVLTTQDENCPLEAPVTLWSSACS